MPQKASARWNESGRNNPMPESAALGSSLGSLQGVDLGFGASFHLKVRSKIAATLRPFTCGNRITAAELLFVKKTDAVATGALLNHRLQNSAVQFHSCIRLYGASQNFIRRAHIMTSTSPIGRLISIRTHVIVPLSRFCQDKFDDSQGLPVNSPHGILDSPAKAAMLKKICGEAHMARFRTLKTRIRPWLKRADWIPENSLPDDISGDDSLLSLVNPLLACLPEGGIITDRAAFALGGVLSKLYNIAPEEAKNAVRRLMWHMNEESGNIGWGVPEAFEEALAQSRPLAEQYHTILFSYIRELDTDSTYCDHAFLRRSCYKAVGKVASTWPDLAFAALTLLEKGLNDPDEICRELAAEQLVLLKKTLAGMAATPSKG
jgi:hypothetical protein